MNTNLTYQELIRHLDMYSTDPIVRKLIEYIGEKEETIIESLVEAGMDPVDCRFQTDMGYCYPGEYITELRKNLDFYQEEASTWEYKYEDMKDERDRLQARSVANLLHEMNLQIKRAQDQAHDADRTATQLKQRNKDLEEKINVWQILERE